MHAMDGNTPKSKIARAGRLTAETQTTKKKKVGWIEAVRFGAVEQMVIEKEEAIDRYDERDAEKKCNHCTRF